MARPTLARRLGTATLLTALALVTAACGNDSEPDTSSGTDSSESAEEAGSTEDSEVVEDAEPSAELEELEAAEFYPAVMAALQEAETFAFTLSTSAEGSDAGTMEMEGVMRYDDKGADLRASGVAQGGQKLEMVMLDKVLYMTGMGMDLGNKKWLKIDMSDPNSLFGMLGKSTDPQLMFKAMEEPKSFEILGTEEIDGVETTHYEVVMDTSAYTEAMDIPAQMATSLPKDIAVEMWVDADDLPRQFRQQLELPTAGGTSTTEGTYSDYGTEVTIEAPPASEVADKMPGM